MPPVTITVHPDGLAPLEAVRAFVKSTDEGMSLDKIIAEGDIVNYKGDVPGRYALWSGIRRVKESEECHGYPVTKYMNSGRRKALTESERRSIISFVEQWRSKRFCTCGYIRRELGLKKVSVRTINRCLNDSGYTWRRVPKVQGLTEAQLKKRKQFVNKFIARNPSWWEKGVAMVLDGVTLTKAPRPLGKRQKHAALRITNMWVKDGEATNNDIHTFNRYGVQLGRKIPSEGRLHWQWSVRPPPLDPAAEDEEGRVG